MEKESKVAKMQPGKDEKVRVPLPVSTADMVLRAIEKTDSEKNGVSLNAIKKYISNEHSVDMDRHGPRIRKYVKKALETGILVQVKGRGANGSFKKGDGKPKTTSKAIQKMTEKKVKAGPKSKVKKVVVATTEGGTEQTSAPETGDKKKEKKTGADSSEKKKTKDVDSSEKKRAKTKDADSSKKKMAKTKDVDSSEKKTAKKNDAGPSEKKRAQKNDADSSEKKRAKKEDQDSSEKKHGEESEEQKPTPASDDQPKAKQSKNSQEDGRDKKAVKMNAAQIPAKSAKLKLPKMSTAKPHKSGPSN